MGFSYEELVNRFHQAVEDHWGLLSDSHSDCLPKPPEPSLLVLVECLSQYRMRYVAQTPVDHPEYALDDVVMECLNEFSQKHLGETIVSHRVVTREEALRLWDEDNPECSGWSEERKTQSFLGAD